MPTLCVPLSLLPPSGSAPEHLTHFQATHVHTYPHAHPAPHAWGVRGDVEAKVLGVLDGRVAQSDG
eukprot:351304-Chlamydomonas_euryale.AAC.2